MRFSVWTIRGVGFAFLATYFVVTGAGCSSSVEKSKEVPNEEAIKKEAEKHKKMRQEEGKITAK